MTIGDKLNEMFMYHPPLGDDNVKYIAIRSAAKTFASVVCDLTPVCADQAAAVRHIREAVMTANAAIALKGIV